MTELERLLAISNRLASLNERLERELTDSKRSSAELARSLENSRIELDALRNELEASRSTSTELGLSAARSEKDSTALKEAQTKADSSLSNLEASFAAYRKTAEERIASLERSSFWNRLVAGASSLLALAGWSAFLIVVAF